jgi:hypothetical protein
MNGNADAGLVQALGDYGADSFGCAGDQRTRAVESPGICFRHFDHFAVTELQTLLRTS